MSAAGYNPWDDLELDDDEDDVSAAPTAKEQAEAEAKAKEQAEAEAKIREEMEAKIREEMEARMKAEAEAKVRGEMEARMKAEAEANVRKEGAAGSISKEGEIPPGNRPPPLPPSPGALPSLPHGDPDRVPPPRQSVLQLRPGQSGALGDQPTTEPEPEGGSQKLGAAFNLKPGKEEDSESLKGKGSPVKKKASMGKPRPFTDQAKISPLFKKEKPD